MDTPLKKFLGDKTAKALATHLDLHTAGDLLYHFPRRYDERGEHTDIRTLEVGEQVTVLAQVLATNRRKMKGGTDEMLEVTVSDGAGGVLGLTYFGRRQVWRERELRPGRWGCSPERSPSFGASASSTAPSTSCWPTRARRPRRSRSSPGR
ncbi:hypothetical protein Prum_027470 [Phytohabitans rumicis]|uniref:RecG wedge domain-containing protein n=1 Tax=Phytohabitans rumicis TaxID=1076125 RepID=A0A6V8L8T1_9ACTN|nr:hypothetical protein Prum_027470 [Phytohabitans rumicis]